MIMQSSNLHSTKFSVITYGTYLYLALHVICTPTIC